MNDKPQWAKLPSLVLTRIYDYLDFEDRLKVSGLCWHYRQQIFQPRYFKKVHFVIKRKNDKKNYFFLQKLAHIVSDAKITFDSCNLYDVELAAEILYKLSKSTCLVSLFLRPKYATLVTPGRFYSEEEWNYISKLFVEPIKHLLLRKKPSFIKLDLGGSEILTLHATDFLNSVSRPQHFSILNLASVKQNPSHYALSMIESNLFEKFTSLEILSLDYDVMCDEFLQSLQILNLKRLIIHVHGVDDNHPGISERAWASFRENNQDTQLHLTLLCAYEAVEILHSHIFRPSMPLSHLKVLFCERINCEALEYLSRNYKDTLRSMVWVDSMRIQEYRNIMELLFRTEQDPLVMMAWVCKKLEEIVIHGYILDPHNLVGISRLRGRELKKLEVSRVDLSISSVMIAPFIEEISTQLDQVGWSPLDTKTLPLALGFCTVSDEIRDQYIQKIVRSDLE